MRINCETTIDEDLRDDEGEVSLFRAAAWGGVGEPTICVAEPPYHAYFAALENVSAPCIEGRTYVSMTLFA